MAFFYYAGHGLQAERANYLLPTSYGAETEGQRVKCEAVAQDMVGDALEPA